jgi:hypothetical protein
VSWLAFHYRPTALFSLKSSRATSTVGKTLVVPTPYAVKMAFLDAGLCTGRLPDPDGFVRSISGTRVRIGVPEDACVTGTIQKIRQEPKKPTPEQPYISNVALREVVHFRGVLEVAFEDPEHREVLMDLAAVVNYLGKRGSFVQYEGFEDRPFLDTRFTRGLHEDGDRTVPCHLATLDDFGPDANFDALNSFSETQMKRGKHRTWLESVVPLGVHNAGPGFVHYKR